MVRPRRDAPGSLGQAFTLYQWVTVALSSLASLVIAVWLWTVEKPRDGAYVLWALSALFLKYWVLVLYVGYRLLPEAEAERESAKP